MAGMHRQRKNWIWYSGTLTLMEMMVVSAVTARSAFKVTGNGYAPDGEVKKNGKSAGKEPALDLMGRVSMLCNDAELFEEDGAWKLKGDPTEGALYPFATKLGIDRQAAKSLIRGSMLFRSNQSTSSWRPCIRRRTVRNCSSQGRARSHPRALRPTADRR
jgi:magnesium-transporting ATPase (P-type)